MNETVREVLLKEALGVLWPIFCTDAYHKLFRGKPIISDANFFLVGSERQFVLFICLCY